MSGANTRKEIAHLRFAPEVRNCPCCKRRLLVRKIRSREIVILDTGSALAEETQLYCPGCRKSPIFHSEALNSLVAPGAKFGYNVMVYVGQATFQHHRTAEEIVSELSLRNVPISLSEVRLLARMFVLYLAEAHGESQKALKALLQNQGGYILHLDGTCDGGSSHLMSALDGLSDLVLMSIKVESEKADDIVPMLIKIRETYGAPLAIVTDMSKAIRMAIEQVFPTCPHYICHFHFLRDLGKDLLEPAYKKIRELLQGHGICALLRRRSRELRAEMKSEMEIIDLQSSALEQGFGAISESSMFSAPLAYAMIEWALAGKNQGDGYGFPFDLPHVCFYQRLKMLSQALTLIAGEAHTPKAGRTLAAKLNGELQSTLDDKNLKICVAEIHQKKEVFDQLRLAMRITRPDDQTGLNDEGADEDRPTLEGNVALFCDNLRQRPDFGNDNAYKKMDKQLIKYWNQLFADPIRIQANQKNSIIYPNRTNNALERLFRSLNHDHRRQTGNNSMKRRLNAMLGDTPLVKNLQNPTYMKILLDGCPTLEARFSRIDAEKIRKKISKTQQEAGRTLPGLRKIFSLPTWPLDVAKSWVLTNAGRKSNRVLCP